MTIIQTVLAVLTCLSAAYTFIVWVDYAPAASAPAIVTAALALALLAALA